MFPSAAAGVPTYSHDIGRFATAEISPVDAVRDTDGNWYVMDEGLACIRVYSPGLTTVIRTIFTCGVIGNDSTHITRARGIGINPTTSALWVADTENNRLVKVNRFGTVLLTTKAPAAPSGPLARVWDVAVDPAGYAYAVDGRNRVVKVSPQGSFVAEFGSTGSGPGQMILPQSIAYSDVGAPAVYITDARNHQVDKFGVWGHFKGSFGSLGTGNGQFTRDARGVAVDAKGVIYGADVGGNRIVRFKPSGAPLPSLGTGLPYSRSGPRDLFYGARGLFAAGNTLAVSDMWNYRVQLWSTLDGSFLGQIGGTPPPRDGHVEPRGLAIGGTAVAQAPAAEPPFVYVSDYWHQYIEVFEPDGTFVTRWGIGRGSGPGTLNLPGGIELDNARGYLYIANREQNSVDRWHLSNGSFDARFSPPGGPLVEKAWPRDVAVNETTGAFYVADEKNHKVDIIRSTGTVAKMITTYGPSGQRLGAVQSVELRAERLFVADWTHKMVHVYDSSGNWLRSFTTNERPNGLFVRDGVVWVLSWRVAQYTTFGVPIRHWSGTGSADGQLLEPYVGIVVDDGGKIYIGDSRHHRVKVFTP
jgi:tripartite motif-containing protein 71